MYIHTGLTIKLRGIFIWRVFSQHFPYEWLHHVYILQLVERWKARLITPSVVSERLKVNGSVARQAIRHLEDRKGEMRCVSAIFFFVLCFLKLHFFGGCAIISEFEAFSLSWHRWQLNEKCLLLETFWINLLNDFWAATEGERHDRPRWWEAPRFVISWPC